MQRHLSKSLLALLAAPLAAQTVHYPDDQHANPPAYGYPFYTPGAGSLGQAVRVQFRCPDSFLQNEGLSAGYVTSVGLSLGGAAPYSQFVLRAGVTSVTALGPDWAVNLPDQRVQRDLSGATIVGGGTAQSPLNEWVDFQLDFPFHYQPGDHIVVDLTTELGQVGVMCSTTVGNGLVERAYNDNYAPGAQAAGFNFSGLKVRFDFAPLEMVEFGAGCAGGSAVTPDLGAIGTPQLGTTVIVTADQVAPNGLGMFVFGYSKSEFAGAALPQALGGGCDLLVAADLIEALTLPASGATAYSITIPSAPVLRGSVLYAQFAQYDPTSPASIPFVVSEGGILSIY